MQLRYTLRQLSVFLAVAQTGSTTAAGKALSMSQSAVSAALGDLERAAAERLFDRHGRRLVLNDAGRALQPQVAALLDAAHNLGREFESPGISLRIAASSTIGIYVLPPILARFRKAHPNARLTVQIGNTREVVAAIKSFDADIGLIEGRAHDPTMQVEHWLEDELVVVTAPGNPLARGDKHGDLAQGQWLVREPGSGTREFIEEQLGNVLGTLNIVLELGNSEAIRRTLLNGYGISCMSRHVIADDLEYGRLIQVSAGLPILRRTLSIIQAAGKTPTRGLAAFHAFLEAYAVTARQGAA